MIPLLQTLEIEEVITEKQVEQQRSRFKRIVLALSSMMRNFAMGCRRRMNEVDAKKNDSDVKTPKTGAGKVEVMMDVETTTDFHPPSTPENLDTEDQTATTSEPALTEAPS